MTTEKDIAILFIALIFVVTDINQKPISSKAIVTLLSLSNKFSDLRHLVRITRKSF